MNYEKEFGWMVMANRLALFRSKNISSTLSAEIAIQARKRCCSGWASALLLATRRTTQRDSPLPLGSAVQDGSSLDRDEASMISAREALERLREGNRRFVSDVRSSDPLTSQARRNELAAGQEPFAIILGCSDSRVPAEIVFDQGLGDLFVIRVAGNIVASSQVGSVEFAAARFGTRLVVVLGHSQCGAILATVEQLQQPMEKQSPNLRSIVDRVRPSVEPLLATELRHEPEAL